MSQQEFDEPEPRLGELEDYEPPALVALGTVREITEGFVVRTPGTAPFASD